MTGYCVSKDHPYLWEFIGACGLWQGHWGFYLAQGTHCTGKTGKMAKEIPCQGNREFGNFAKTQGKHREFALLKL